jgi:hypothetical protein
MPPEGDITLNANFTDDSQSVHIEESQDIQTILLNLLTPVLIYVGGNGNGPKIIVSIANDSQFIYDTMVSLDWQDFIDFTKDPISWQTPIRLINTANYFYDFLNTDVGKNLVNNEL